LIDRIISNFTLLLSMVYFITSLLLQLWIPAAMLFAWWMFSRGIRLTPHLARRPGNVKLVPVYVFTSFAMAIVRLYALFTTLNADPKLKEFSFITRWPKLSPEEKRTYFGKYASHELNLFLFHKDPEFFEAAVKPFLANKYRQQFVDHWLLGDDLKRYLDPWEYGRLNVVEKVLLIKRVVEEQPQTLRFLQEGLDLVPPDPERSNLLFMTALYGGALGAEGGGLQNAEVGGRMHIRGNWYDYGFSRQAGGGFGGGGFGGGPAINGQVNFFTEMPTDSAESLETVGRDGDGILTYDLKAGRELQLGEELDRISSLGYLPRKEEYRRLYQAVKKTQEWVENDYFKVPLAQQRPEMVPLNGLWLDFAQAAPGTPFRSEHVAEAAGSSTEALLALAVLDLPFEAPEHDVQTLEGALTLKAGGPLVAFFKDIEPAAAADAATPVLVSQNYFRQDDRYRHEGNQRFDKFITNGFVINVVYGCQVTVTNPTSTPHLIELLRQVPEGAIPVAGGRYAKSERLALNPYSTAALEYYFYFPRPGEFKHYPVHVSEDGKLLAFAEPHAFSVAAAPSALDTASWQFISQQGSPEDVLRFLQDNNLNRIDLGAMAWRLRDKAFYAQALAQLAQRHIFHPALWSFAILHNDPPNIALFLHQQPEFVRASGAWLESPLLTIDPVDERLYQHVEYLPLINPRVHRLNQQWTITNDQLRRQYASLMDILAHRPDPGQPELLSLCYYLLLQDRVEEALRFFARLAPEQLETALQYDYLKAYLAFYQEDPAAARQIAARYADYPVERWRTLFADVAQQADEISGAMVAQTGVSPKQDQLAAQEPRLEMEVNEDTVTLFYSNLQDCTLSFYPVDAEMLFTRDPFNPAQSNIFSGIKPTATLAVPLDAATPQLDVPLPPEFAKQHVVIRAEAAGLSRSAIRYASNLVAQVIESFGQIQVSDKATNAPLPKIYVKVFSRMNDGGVLFYRDGYTDLRGRFDYAASSTLDVGNVAQFAILVLGDEHGAKVLTAAPPGR
ncbi:MAG: hypothetical protein HYZ00_00200, partial [Candidatus Hydrogenedentes bacterium]|nr:hypothetical protein [Candidatus Hydrogenedentota bacterium]